jgi:hypothetical protein
MKRPEKVRDVLSQVLAAFKEAQHYFVGFLPEPQPFNSYLFALSF